MTIEVEIRLKQYEPGDTSLLTSSRELLVDAFTVGLGCDKPGVLISRLRVGALTGHVVETFTVLSLISSDHIDRLLEKIEIEVLVGGTWRKIEVSIYERLGAGIK